MSSGSPEAYSKKERRRLLSRAMGLAGLKVTVLFLLYFYLPFDKGFSVKTIVGLTLAMIVVIALIIVEYRATIHSPYPRLTAAVGMSVVITVFVLAFAIFYYMLELSATSSFTTPMTRLDSLYFTTTVLTTVGFGDITAKSEMARAVTTIQMFADLVLIGVVVRALMSAVGSGLSVQGRRAPSDLPPAPTS
jgi:voltage-gated potassium channel